jgi:hypothetical protein
MSRWLVAALILVSLGLAGALVTQLGSGRRIERDLSDMRGRLERIEVRQDEIASLVETVARAVRDATNTGPRLLGGNPAASAPLATRPPPAASSPGASDQALTDMVERKVEEKLRAQAQKPPQGGDRKLPLHDLAKELALDPPTQGRVAEISDAAKRQILDIAKTPRPDGTSLADDLVNAMMKGDEKAMKQMFGKLFTDKIPGSDMTYLAAIGGIQKEAGDGLEQVMGSDTFGRFRHMNLKPENIETGFDPWAEYVRDRKTK